MKEIIDDIRTPFEMISAAYRFSKHDTEKEVRQIIKSILDYRNGGNQSTSELTRLLRQDRQKLVILKRKLSKSSKNQSKLYDTCKKRIHFQEEPSPKNLNFNLDVVQYLNSNNKIKESYAFQERHDLKTRIEAETDIYAQTHTISEHLLKQNVLPLRNWCDRNTHMLNKLGSTLLIQVNFCEFISKLYQQGELQACLLLRNCFKGATLSENDKHEIGKLMMMLIKRESDVDKYFVRTERLFKEAVSKIYHIDFNSHLDKTIAIGVSVLKTVCCSHSETKNPQICPICEPKTNKFSQKIPMIARNESSLKCRINQSIMNEQNYPMTLPNGQIYSSSGLQETKKGNEYYCPQNETYYQAERARRIYMA